MRNSLSACRLGVVLLGAVSVLALVGHVAQAQQMPPVPPAPAPSATGGPVTVQPPPAPAPAPVVPAQAQAAPAGAPPTAGSVMQESQAPGGYPEALPAASAQYPSAVPPPASHVPGAAVLPSEQGMGSQYPRQMSQGVPPITGAGDPGGPYDANGAPPPLSDGDEVSRDRNEGFNNAIDQLFPMTPDMLRRLRTIYENSQEAILERPEPNAIVGADIVSLEPGARPPRLDVVPGIASVISFYDATGQSWPISQYVLGNGSGFQVIHLADSANSMTVTPLIRVGWTDIIVTLKGEPTPVVISVRVGSDRAHYRHDLTVMAMGPNAKPGVATDDDLGPRAGNATLLAALTGADMPQKSKQVAISGVRATAWLTGGDLYIRSKTPLISPSWLESMAGPDGMRVYKLNPSPVLLFSRDGQIVRATVELP